MAYLAFAFVCLMWGSTFILTERVSHIMGPVEIGVWRLFLGAAALGVIWWWKRDRYRLDRRDWGPILFSAAVANVPPYVTQPYVLAQGFGHSFFGVAVAAIPLLTILMSIPMLGLWPTRRQLLGVFGGLACLWFVVDDGFDRGMSVGILALAAVVPITAAFNNNFIKLTMPKTHPLPLTAVMLASAGVMLLPLEFSPRAMEALDLTGPANPEFTFTSIASLIILGVVATGLSTVAFFYLVLQRGPLFAGMATYIVPMLALAWGQFDHEAISAQQLVAMAGVLVMVGIVQTGPPRFEESIEVLPDATADALASAVPPPLGLCPETVAVPAAMTSTVVADSAVISSPVTSA